VDYSQLVEDAVVCEEFKEKFLTIISEDLRSPVGHWSNKQIAIDITVNEGGSTENIGLVTTHYILKTLRFFPFLQDLVVFFKTLLANHDFNNAYKGKPG
jgi:DNA polymerase sigma